MRKPVRIIQRQQDVQLIYNAVVEVDVLEEQMSSAVLSSFPHTIQTLWNEYEFGLENQKAANYFTAI